MPDEFETRLWAIARQGGVSEAYAKKCVRWFHLFMETRRATESTRAAGFPNAQLSWKGNQLVKKFKPLITEALITGLWAGEPLAMQRLVDIAGESYMVPLVVRTEGGAEKVVLGEDGKPLLVMDAKAAAVIVKASAEILNRGQLPNRKTLDVKVTDEDSRDKANWQDLLDDQVREWGAETVKARHKERLDFLEYLERKYPVKVVGEEVVTATEA